MATIERRVSSDGSETFRVKIRIRGQKAASATFARKSDAKKWAAETETEIRHGNYFKRLEAQQHTLAQLIDRYCTEVLPSKREKTQVGQKLQFQWWKDELGEYFLSAVTPALLSECRSRLAKGEQKGRSPTTVKRYLAALSHAFTVAMKDWQWVSENPVKRLTMPKEPRGRVRYLSEVERNDLLSACKESKNPYLYPIVVIAISTGARKSEILELTWPNLNLESGAITLNDTKNGERRTIPVRGIALELIRGLPRQINSKYVFPSEDGTSWTRIRPHWEAAIKKANLKDFRFHDLRHSCASYLAMNGATPGEIAAVLGHKTLQMVKRYAHIGEQHTAGVLERMNTKILGGQG